MRWGHQRRAEYERAARARLWFCEGAGSGAGYWLMAMDEAGARRILALHRLAVRDLREMPPSTPLAGRVRVPGPIRPPARRPPRP